MKSWAKKLEQMLVSENPDKLTEEDVLEMFKDLDIDASDVQMVKLTPEEAAELEKLFREQRPTLH
jgi:hypothetical protein